MVLQQIDSLPGSRWAAVEIKMGQGAVDKAASGLLRFTNRVDSGKHGEPAALIVVTATGRKSCVEMKERRAG